jgi:RHS repeat-associated protein
VGNRQTLTVDNALTNLTYAPGSNRLQTLAGALPASYALGSGGWTFTYNNANRLVAVLSNNTTVATYRVNALGQRVAKNVGGNSTTFVYDEQGHLLGEYDSSGNLIQETIWLEDLPVATLRPTGTGSPTPIAIYYVHADHLGSPRAITRPSDNLVMWRWDNLDPFGANLANENPSGQGAFRYGLRFPGQYYDAETGTHYNYFRDYDPAVGRYEQSDPIGLKGGLNTYAYVDSNPIWDWDADALMGSRGNVRRVPRFPGSSCGPEGSLFNYPNQFWKTAANPKRNVISGSGST